MNINRDECYAFFDLDYTILNCDSFRLFLRYIYLRNWKGRLSIPILIMLIIIRKLRFISLQKFKEKSLSILLRGFCISDIKSIGHEFFVNHLVKHIRDMAIHRIQIHKSQGHKIMIITGSPDIYVDNIRDFLSADYYVCTRLAYEKGRFTGKIDGNDCIGIHKANEILLISKNEEINLKLCYSYSDSLSDVPMMKLVGNATVINPSGFLCKLAKDSSWNIETW